MSRVGGVVVLVGLVGCSASTSSSTGSDAVAEVTADTSAATAGGYGQRCATDGDCATGLCAKNDLAPFGFCSAACTAEKTPCPPVGAVEAYCVQFPAAFSGVPNPICLPRCDHIKVCEGLGAQWETCEVPKYTGSPVYGTSVNVKVCQAPSAHGKAKLDPATCAGWDTTYGKSYPSQVSVCRAYCDYLIQCKEVPVAGYSKECCAYGCLVDITRQGEVNTIIEKKRKCYVQNFSAWQGTGKVCTAHIDDPNCPDKPDNTRTNP